MRSELVWCPSCWKLATRKLTSIGSQFPDLLAPTCWNLLISKYARGTMVQPSLRLLKICQLRREIRMVHSESQYSTSRRTVVLWSTARSCKVLCVLVTRLRCRPTTHQVRWDLSLITKTKLSNMPDQVKMFKLNYCTLEKKMTMLSRKDKLFASETKLCLQAWSLRLILSYLSSQN